jgi:membrane protein DedA with SNARE-associated domain
MAFVLVGRLVPTIRSLVSVPAGLLRLRFRTFFVASLIGTAAWTAVLAGAGYKLEENVDQVGQMVGPASNAVLVVLAAAYLWRLWTHRHQGRRED